MCHLRSGGVFYLNRAPTAYELRSTGWNEALSAPRWHVIEIPLLFLIYLDETHVIPFPAPVTTTAPSVFVRIVVFFVRVNEGLHCMFGHECLRLNAVQHGK